MHNCSLGFCNDSAAIDAYGLASFYNSANFHGESKQLQRCRGCRFLYHLTKSIARGSVHHHLHPTDFSSERPYDTKNTLRSVQNACSSHSKVTL
jgi:hypothetical protein